MFENSDAVALGATDRQARANSFLVRMMFARMDAVAMALALGAVFAAALGLATAILVLKGAPPGMPVGPNLSALSTFLPGYGVSWPGAFVGAIYGMIFGAACGFLLSLFWNLAHVVFIGVAVLRGSWFD